MNICTTEGITIAVDTQYLPAHSDARTDKHVFGYFISISNGGNETVQLLSRQWTIVEAGGRVRNVEGEGVVGRQPVMVPGQLHEYTSFCNLNTEIGKMFGTYLMKRLEDGHLFHVMIPEFVMVAPSKLN
jgi:ApaG protein